MARTTILVGIGIAIAVIIGGIAVFTYSIEADIDSEPEVNTEIEEPEVNTEIEEPGKVLTLRLGESASTGDAP